MKCPKCQFENREEAKFCSECGYKYEITCPKCDNKILFGSKFCDECGENIGEPLETPPLDYTKPQSYTPKFLADRILTSRSSIEGERKLVTVLFADVANFTSMAEKLDPEDVHQLMDGCFQILMDQIHKHEGTINQFTGDGIMALFGAPLAHEDHAQRACYAALEILKGLEKYGEKLKTEFGVDFKMRIGLNSGNVVVGSIGDNLRMDYTAIGDTTNLASRMQSEARPGTVLISENTYRIARDFFRFESLGKVKVKGKAELQEIYELVKISDVQTRLDAATTKGLTKFVGRENSMASLLDAFNKVISGSGQVVGIVGEAGVGKSRLLLELKKKLPEGEYIYLEGRCIHYGSSMTYLPIIDIFRTFFDIKEEDLKISIKQKLEKNILDIDEKLRKILPPFQELFSLKVDDENFRNLDPKQKRDRTFEAILGLLIRICHSKPMVLTVEDLHWIDKTSEELLDHLIGSLTSTSILLILLYRPEYNHQWGSKSNYRKIGLSQLTNQSSTELVQAILKGGEVSPEISELILNRTSGNPLYMEELTHSLLENGSIQKKDHQFTLIGKASNIQIPDTIQGIIAARMDRLEDSHKRTMQAASVIGREFAFRILQMITGFREELKTYLLNLQGLEFIYEKKLFPDLEYFFKHALTQEVAYKSLLNKKRKDIHKKIGKAVEQIYAERLDEFYEMLAYHFTEGGHTEKAIRYWQRAGQRAVQLSANAEAISHLTKGLEMLKTMPDTSERIQQELILQTTLGPALMAAKGPGAPEVEKAYGRAKKLCQQVGETPQLFSVLFGLWRFYIFRARLQTARELAEQLLTFALGNQDSGFLLEARFTLGGTLFWHGDFDSAREHLEQAFDLYDTQQHHSHIFLYGQDPAVVCLSYMAFVLWILGYPDQALKKTREALNQAKECTHLFSLAYALFGAAIVHQLRRETIATQKLTEAVIKLSTDRGFPYFLVVGRILRGSSLAGQKIKKEGIEQMCQSLAVCRAQGVETNRTYYLSLLSEAYRKKRQVENGLTVLAEAQAVVENTGERWWEAELYRLKGELLLMQESVKAGLKSTGKTEAERCFRYAIDVARKQNAKSLELRSVRSLSRLLLGQGKIEEARHILADIYSWFTEGFDTADLKESKALLEAWS